MCDPISLSLAAVTIATSVTSSVVGYAAQSRAADANQTYQNQMAAETYRQQMLNNQITQKSYLNQVASQRLNEAQQEQAGDQKLQQNQIESMQAQASQRVSSGEAGVSGVSIDGLMADFQRTQGMYASSVQQNLNWNKQQTNMDLKGTQAQAYDRINSRSPYIQQPVQRPSAFATGLQIVSDIASTAGNTYNNYNLTKALKS